MNKDKKVKKLSLSMETLRNLETGTLVQAEGGIAQSVPLSACETCRADCTLACTCSCANPCQSH